MKYLIFDTLLQIQYGVQIYDIPKNAAYVCRMLNGTVGTERYVLEIKG